MTTSPAPSTNPATHSSGNSPVSSSASPAATSPATALDRDPIRLSLRPGPHSPLGPVDGAWWPRSRELVPEATDLVDHFPHEVGRIQRLLFSPPDWDAAPGSTHPRRIHAARGPIKIGFFPRDDTHLMILKMASGVQLQLLVIPSRTSPDVAEQVLSRAAHGAGTDDARALLGLT